jgi:hypothetical protein
MKRDELLREWAMEAIANEYEDLTTINQEVTTWASEAGHSVNAEEITEALLRLIDSGLAAAYMLSTQKPVAKKLTGRPKPGEVAKCHFLLTDEGKTELTKHAGR